MEHESRSNLRREHILMLLLSMVMTLCGWNARIAEGALPLVEGGASDYVIYYKEDAPDSIKLAAEEIQRAIKLSTSAELVIRTEPADLMICLGNNSHAESAGLSTNTLSDDSFLIVTKGRVIYILGKDRPPDKSEWIGWISRGTLYGAYHFLEKVVGVRWLLPGQWGEDIPKHVNLSVQEMNIAESPDFQIRRLRDVQDWSPRWRHLPPNGVKEWLWRNKCSSAADGAKLQHGHAWVDYVSPEILTEHPEFRAVKGGPRKLCTTNPELVSLFAQNVIKWLDKRPRNRSASISPTDGGNFCRCPRCSAMVTKDPHGWDSYTRVMLTFYNQIAKRVRETHPDRLLAAYVYYNYTYPPEKPMKIEPNLCLFLTPLRYYGWGLAKAEYRAEFDDLVKAWSSLTPNLYYHNYSTWMRSFNGAPLPPGLDILKLELPTLKKYGVKGVEMVGIGAWGYGGPGNYILAKQMWDADIDVEATYREWLQRAYGPGWNAMDRIYTKLEGAMLAHKRKEPITTFSGASYEVNYELIEKIHLPFFPEMERLYLEALSKAESEAQRRRLAMFGDNLIMLHYQMWKAGMLKEADARKSYFYRNDAEYEKFYKDAEFSLALYRDHGKRHSGRIWKGEWDGR